jgi:hypothetical protein
MNFQYQSDTLIDILDGGLSGNALVESDMNAKIIADGVYNVYVEFDDANDGKSTNIRRRDISHSYVRDEVIKSITSAGAILDPKQGSRFTGKLLNYHTVTASTVPITANNFKIHFLNPFAMDPDGGNRHFAEFGVAVTPFKPEIDTLNSGALRFRDKNTNLLVPFDKQAVPFVEWTQVGTQFNYEAKAEELEWNPGYGYRFGVDARLPQPSGTDSGYISAIRCEVRNVPYDIDLIEPGTGDFAGKWKITFTDDAPPAIVLDISNQTSEVGVNDIGLGIFYVSNPFTENSKVKIYVSGDPTNNGTGPGARTVTQVQVKTVTIYDDWQLSSFEDDGTPKFTYRTFENSKAIKFNSQPLYVVFALKDYARINNIVIEEITEKSVKTHTPVFIKDANRPAAGNTPAFVNHLNIVNSGGSSNILSPSAFDSENRLDSVRFDTSTLNPLRPSTVLYSFFVAPNKPERIDLSNIFGRDRKGLARGLLNNKAIFFTASNLNSTAGVGGSLGNIEIR